MPRWVSPVSRDEHCHRPKTDTVGQARETTGIPWVQAEIDAMNAEADLLGAPRIVVKNTSARP